MYCFTVVGFKANPLTLKSSESASASSASIMRAIAAQRSSLLSSGFSASPAAALARVRFL